MEVFTWDIYEVVSSEDVLHGVMLRGRIRKFCIESNQNCLVENASDKENTVRFAVPIGNEVKTISDFVGKILKNVQVEKVADAVPNPVLSKLKVNDLSRYILE